MISALSKALQKRKVYFNPSSHKKLSGQDNNHWKHQFKEKVILEQGNEHLDSTSNNFQKSTRSQKAAVPRSS